jgi:hypothetical protein
MAYLTIIFRHEADANRLNRAVNCGIDRLIGPDLVPRMRKAADKNDEGKPHELKKVASTYWELLGIPLALSGQDFYGDGRLVTSRSIGVWRAQL